MGGEGKQTRLHLHVLISVALYLSIAVFPTRQMSFGLPVSGTNIAYIVLGGSSLTAALVYVCILYYVSVIIVIFTKTTVYLNFVSPRCFLLQAYKTINSDSARYNERIAQLEARPKSKLIFILFCGVVLFLSMNTCFHFGCSRSQLIFQHR